MRHFDLAARESDCNFSGVELKLFSSDAKLENMSAKETLLEVAEKLPSDATLVDAIYELEFRQAVEEGLASLDRGKKIPLDEARKKIPQWISKYSSQTKR